MLQIKDTLVSLDLVEKFFACDITRCKGECCIEGDAGAPITDAEFATLKEILPDVWDDLLPAAQRRIQEEGVGYVDEEGDLVTQIVEGKNCVFSTYRHRKSIPRRAHQVYEAYFMPPLSGAHYRI